MEIRRDGEVAVMVLRAGRANAMDDAFLRGLLRLFDELESSDARAAVLTGYDTFFSAGLAIPTLLSRDRDALRPFMMLFESAMRRAFTCPLPVVAAVNGHAIAGGCVLALQCDLRFIADASVKIGLSEAQLGVGLPPSAMEALRFHVPSSSLAAIAIGGSLFAPSEAKGLGLVDEVVPPADLLSRAVERARALAVGSRQAVAQIKHALRQPALERMERESAQELETWLDGWFSPASQERLMKVAARLTAKG